MAGKRTKNLKEIADELGVSIATVSRALNDSPEVRQSTKDRVVDYAQKTGYQGRSPSRRSTLVGVVGEFADFNSLPVDHFFSRVMDAIFRRLESFGYHPVLLMPGRLQVEFARSGVVQVLRDLCGVIWITAEYTASVDKMIKAHDLQCVAINHRSDNVDQYLIQSDNYNATKTVVEYLLGRGHRAIGFVGGFFDLLDHRERMRGYVETMKANGITIAPHWIIDDITNFGEEGGAEAIHRLLAKSDPPTAAVLINDELAIGAYKGAREMGFSIPDDISFVGYDDFPIAPYLDPPLTSMRQDCRLMGRRAAETLLRLVNGSEMDGIQKVSYFRMRLVPRDSVCTR
jgi:LacI family transcriptional regulator